MLCYRDMTFCASRLCINEDCQRHAIHTEHNDEGLPVAWCDFSDRCPDYRSEEECSDD